MTIHELKKIATLEMIQNLTKEIEITFDRCFLESFYLMPTEDGLTNGFIANYKGGSQYLYYVPFETIINLLTADSFGRTFNLTIKKLDCEKL